MRVLFLTRYGEHVVGAPSTFHGFEQAVGKIVDCKWAGTGYVDHEEGENVDETVQRIMPDADWVIVDKNTLLPAKQLRNYRVGVFLSDLHGKYSHGLRTPKAFLDHLNTLNYDAFFLKYMEVHGTEFDPYLFKEGLNGDVYHLPWSVDCDRFQPKKKQVDVTFIGAVGKVYPLRQSMWSGVHSACKGYKVVRETSPRGRTFERDTRTLNHRYVGDAYSDLLNDSRIVLLGSSIYRYPVQKYFEASASGALILADSPSTAKYLEFVDGKTFFEVNVESWRDRLQHCLDNPSVVRAVSSYGLNTTVTHHSHKTRAKQFIEML